ncbi:Chromodomain Y-like protein 2 [Favolaschia claudopus]|uniref:Chromodomain Y-like protein 2 n=1 Tax=Favolaschia claudopus TaxID=2862362 RepID=A0AAW0B3H5_9AGAR
MAEYEVESITEARVAKKSKKMIWEYSVKWKGYGLDENTWEPKSSFKGSEDIIDKFWARVDIGGRDINHLAQFKVGERFMPVGPPRRKQSQRNLKSDETASTPTASAAGPSKEATRTSKRRRSSPTPDEDEKPAKRTRGRASEMTMPPVQSGSATPREPPQRPPAKTTPSIRRTRKRTPSPKFVPASEDEAEEDDVAMLVDPEPPSVSISTAPPLDSECPSIAPDTGAETLVEPPKADIPSLPAHRARAAKPLVKMADDFEPLESAIPAKARLRKGTTDDSPASGPSTSPRRSTRRPGPGRSSAGLNTKNSSSLLTFEKGELKTKKGKFTARATEAADDVQEDSVDDAVDAAALAPPTGDELLKLGGLDEQAAETLENFEDEDVPPVHEPESNPNQASLTSAKNKLFPPGTFSAPTFSNSLWKRATIFGPLGLGSDTSPKAPSDSKPFSLKLDTTIVVPLDLIDVHNSLNTIIKEDASGPPGKFFKSPNAMKLLDTIRTGGPSARVVISSGATEEQQAHFKRFRSRLDQGDLFTVMAGPIFLGFSSSATPLMQRLNLPPTLTSVPDSIFITQLQIENVATYEVLETADTTRWSA